LHPQHETSCDSEIQTKKDLKSKFRKQLGSSPSTSLNSEGKEETLECLKSRGIFRCDCVLFEFSSVSHSEIRLLLSTCGSLYCSHAQQIKEDLDKIEQQAKATLPTGNRRTLPQRDTETAKK